MTLGIPRHSDSLFPNHKINVCRDFGAVVLGGFRKKRHSAEEYWGPGAQCPAKNGANVLGLRSGKARYKPSLFLDTG